MEECICPTCGKKFIPAPQHALRDDKGFYCKCTCFLHRPKKAPRGKKRRKVEQYTADGVLVNTYASLTQAYQYSGHWMKGIQKACQDGTEYCGFRWKYAD